MNSSSAPPFSAIGALNQTKMITLEPVNKKRARSSAAIEADDLLLQIMSRLPSHSIQRFKTVCHQWHSLITNPMFRKLWRKHNLNPPTALILSTRQPVSILFLPLSTNTPTTLLHLKPPLKIIQSCNGLLLCLTKKMYNVYNPTTNTCHTLPELDCSIVQPGMKIHSMNLAFDPKKFGPHYKVICCVSLENSKRVLHVHIYSSDTCVWKSIFNLMYTGNVNKDKGVYWNGSINWMYDLTYFDIENETFNEMPRPTTGTKWRRHYFFGESCGRLNCAHLCKPKGGDPGCVDVYELKLDYSEWVLKYCVKLNLLHLITSVVSVVHGLEEDVSFLVLVSETETELRLIRYNLVFETLEVMPVSFSRGTIVHAFQYIESQYRV